MISLLVKRIFFELYIRLAEVPAAKRTQFMFSIYNSALLVTHRICPLVYTHRVSSNPHTLLSRLSLATVILLIVAQRASRVLHRSFRRAEASPMFLFASCTRSFFRCFRISLQLFPTGFLSLCLQHTALFLSKPNSTVPFYTHYPAATPVPFYTHCPAAMPTSW